MTSRKSLLMDELAAFDGKHTSVLERITRRHSKDRDFEKSLFDASKPAQPAHVRVAATWLLLHQAKSDVTNLAGHEQTLVTLLAGESSWEVRLHLLQALDMIDLKHALDARSKRTLLKAAVNAANDPSSLVRTWSLSVLAQLGNFMPSARPSIAALIRVAEKNSPASTKARIRRLRASGVLAWMDQ